jgi:hypothetical protein
MTSPLNKWENNAKRRRQEQAKNQGEVEPHNSNVWLQNTGGSVFTIKQM